MATKLIPCPACKTRPEINKGSCLLAAEHDFRTGKVPIEYAATQ